MCSMLQSVVALCATEVMFWCNFGLSAIGTFLGSRAALPAVSPQSSLSPALLRFLEYGARVCALSGFEDAFGGLVGTSV